MTDPEKVGILQTALRMVLANIPSHFPDCSFGASNGPDGDYCDCNMRNIRQEARAILEKTK